MTSPTQPVSRRHVRSSRGARPLAALGAALLAVHAWPVPAQDAETELPEITVTTSSPQPRAPATNQAAGGGSPQPQPPSDGDVSAEPARSPVRPGTRSGSLTVPTAAEATADIARTPGGVEVVPAEAYKASTPSVTIKDALDYVPGVFVQPKWGEDSRLSIRGSGLSRNFHLRGVQLYMDGIPINTADGYGDFQEIDPTAYRYIEVYKGANALRFGANALGGAINFVMPTGYDADPATVRVDIGSFGFRKLSSSSGGVSGPVDYFIAGTWQEQDGFREHSEGTSVRGALNIGYRLSPDVETRFYLNAADVDQRIPGAVTKAEAQTNPKGAFVRPGLGPAGTGNDNVDRDYQRNIETVRIANKTSVRVSQGTLLEFGAFNVDRHLMHPIFQWLDYRYDDYGAFARLIDESRIAGFANRVILGANLHNGTIDARQYVNDLGNKGALVAHTDDRSRNFSAYFENHLFVTPGVAFVAGTQFLHATRERVDLIGTGSGETEFNLWSPKVGVLWDITPAWQAFANVSRSAEVPSFGESVAAEDIRFTDIKAQRATTYEIGTRGRTADTSWDLALYRANIDNELLCFTRNPAMGTCQVGNADETIHQGIELGFGVAVLKSLLADGMTPDALWLNTAYTFSDFRYDGDAEWGDNELPGAPRHFLRAELLYRHPSGLYFGPNVEWVPVGYYVDSENSFKTDAYAIWGAKIGFDNGGPITAYIEGRNLSDEAYIASASIATAADDSSALFEPGTGRAVYGGVQVKW